MESWRQPPGCWVLEKILVWTAQWGYREIVYHNMRHSSWYCSLHKARESAFERSFQVGFVEVCQVLALPGSQEASARIDWPLAESSMLNWTPLENLPPFHSRQIDNVESVAGGQRGDSCRIEMQLS